MKRRDWLQRSLLASTATMMGTQNLSFLEHRTEISHALRLHWNENPFGPSKKVIKAVQEAVPMANLYWDEKNGEIRKILGDRFGLSSDHFMMTSGSTEILCLLGQHVGLMKGNIVTGDLSFPTISLFGERCGAQIKKVPLQGYKLDLDRMIRAISSETELVFICNPNNPTSTEVSYASLIEFCKAVPEDVLICVDEAYIEFSDLGEKGSLASMVKDLPNLIIVRTFSKAYGLAGFRLGYAISQPHNIEALNHRYPALGMSPGLLPLVAGITALDDQAFVNEVVTKVNSNKQLLSNQLSEWGTEFAQSSTNFMYVSKSTFVPDVRERLKDQGILITQWGMMKGHVRISIGKRDWIESLIRELGQLLA